MGRRILNRKELRADYDAAERREETEEEEGEEEEGDEDEDEEEGEEDEPEAEGDDAEGDEEPSEDDEEEKPKKKKAKPKKVAAPRAKPRRTAKVTRMRVVWGVFDNSHRCVATYAYPKKGEAEEHATRLTTDKRSTHFIQPVKEEMKDEK